MSVKRNGFKDGLHAKSQKGVFTIGGENDDQLKGTDNADAVNGNGGDDVLIAYAGDDAVAGGAGKDSISGGAGDDTLTGGIWADDAVDGTAGDVDGDAGTVGKIDADELSQDTDSDTFDAESTFAANGTDTILLYDAPEDAEGDVADVIDLTDAFVLNVVDGDDEGDTVDQAEIDAALAAMVAYDDATGALTIGSDTWFKVFSDAAMLDAADHVVIKVAVSMDGGMTSTPTEFIL